MKLLNDRERQFNTDRCRPHHSRDVIERAREFWDAQGQLSGEIGQLIGLIKNAVGAIARRNGFASRPGGWKAPRQ